MKKQLLSLTLFAAVALTTITTSCKKEKTALKSETENVNATTTKTTAEKLNVLGENYIARDKKNGTPQPLAPSAWRTVVGDACGALSGAWLGPFGAFCGATTASVCYAFGEGTYLVHNEGGSDNGENPYDIYGEMHNASADYILDDINTYIVNNEIDVTAVVNALRSYGNANYSGVLTDESTTTNTEMTDLLDVLLAVPQTGTYNDVLNALEAAGYITSEENGLMDEYFDVFTTTSTPLDYSIGAERIINESEELTGSSKEKILIAMSVSRNSYVLWDEQ